MYRDNSAISRCSCPSLLFSLHQQASMIHAAHSTWCQAGSHQWSTRLPSHRRSRRTSNRGKQSGWLKGISTDPEHPLTIHIHWHTRLNHCATSCGPWNVSKCAGCCETRAEHYNTFRVISTWRLPQPNKENCWDNASTKARCADQGEHCRRLGSSFRTSPVHWRGRLDQKREQGSAQGTTGNARTFRKRHRIISMEEERCPPCEYSLKRTSTNLIQS